MINIREVFKNVDNTCASINFTLETIYLFILNFHPSRAQYIMNMQCQILSLMGFT